MGDTPHNQYADYSNYTIVTNDDLKIWPIVLPWDTTYFNSDGTVKDGVLKGDVLKQLRQHIKALDANFAFPGTAECTNASDAKLSTHAPVDQAAINQVTTGLSFGTQYHGLLDEMLELGILGTASSAGAAEGSVITKSKIDTIATRLKEAANYNNYSNYTNSPVPTYTNVVSHYDYYSGTTRSVICHRNHTNHSNYSDVYQTVNYSNAIYNNTFTNPANYQNTL